MRQRYGRIIALAIAVATLATGALAQDWTPYQALADGSSNGVDVRTRWGNSAGGGDRYFLYQFRNRYVEKVQIEVSITLLGSDGKRTPFKETYILEPQEETTRSDGTFLVGNPAGGSSVGIV